MNKLSENNYDFITDLHPNEIKARLQERILKKENLIMERTKMDFIGKIHDNQFSIIDSWFPVGAACVIKGLINEGESTHINLITSLHKAFRILFTIWAIAIAGLLIYGSINAPNRQFSIGSFFALLIAIIFFRLFLHGIYILARNKATKKLEWILELKN
jgi:hypothetical protein